MSFCFVLCAFRLCGLGWGADSPPTPAPPPHTCPATRAGLAAASAPCPCKAYPFRWGQPRRSFFAKEGAALRMLERGLPSDFRWLARTPPPPLVLRSFCLLFLCGLGASRGRYLSTAVQPLVDDATFAQTKIAVEEFRTGAGPRLQHLLVSKDDHHPETSYVAGAFPAGPGCVRS
jgi:hypothetical protein